MLRAIGVVVVMLAAVSAFARPNYVNGIPLAPGEGVCGTCHINPSGGGARNDFGADVEATLALEGPQWSEVFCMDSDGDGKTNGQELRDPCGTWAVGDAAPPDDDVSIPADPASTTAAEDECNGAAPPTCDRPAGCAQAGATTSLAFLALLFVTRRSAARRMIG